MMERIACDLEILNFELKVPTCWDFGTSPVERKYVLCMGKCTQILTLPEEQTVTGLQNTLLFFLLVKVTLKF